MTYVPTDPRLAWLRLLFLARLNLRHQIGADDETHRLTRALERKAKILEIESPLNGHAAQGMRDAAKVVRAEVDALYPRKLKDYGKAIMSMAAYIDNVTTLEDRCEALNVNIADRAELKESDGIIEIIFAHALEDSATHRRSDNNFDKPLFRAVHLAFAEWMHSTPEGRDASSEAFADIFGDLFPLPGEQPIATTSLSGHEPSTGKFAGPGLHGAENNPTIH